MTVPLEGIYRMVVAMMGRYPNSGWVLLHGVVTLNLGLMIWRQWPVSGVWAIGLYVGIHVILSGLSLTLLGPGARRLPDEIEAPPSLAGS